MKKFEIFIGVLSLSALVLNFLFVPYSTLLMSVFFSIAALFYYIFCFTILNNIHQFKDIFKKSVYNEANKKTIFMGFSLSTVIVGILFRFLLLSGSKIILAYGLFCLLIITIVTIIEYLKTPAQFYIGLFFRIAIIGGLGLFLFFLPLNTLIDIKYRNNPEYAESLKKSIKESYNTALNAEELEKMKFTQVKNLSLYEKTDFLPTLEHKIDMQKNAVYCAALLYAWDEARKHINQPFTISPDDTNLFLLNNSELFLNSLKSNEYSASGTIDGSLITAKAEFNKSLPFARKLDSYNRKLTVNGQPVASFGVWGYNGYEQVRIVYYKNNSNFIVKLLPKDKNHEIILFKSDKVFSSMAEMNEEIGKLSEMGENERESKKQQWKYQITNEDEVVIPKIRFNIETNYAYLEGSTFKTDKQNYEIIKAWQRTAFLLDESGAEIESEDEEAVQEEIEEEFEKPKPKKMIFDKDFLILLKRTDSQNPYFGMWVVNTELMIKK